MEFEQLKKGMHIADSRQGGCAYMVLDASLPGDEPRSFYVRRLVGCDTFSVQDEFEEKLDPKRREQTKKLYRYFGCGALPFLSPA